MRSLFLKGRGGTQEHLGEETVCGGVWWWEEVGVGGGGGRPEEQFVIKGTLWKYKHTPLGSRRQINSLLFATQLPTQSHHVPLAGIKVLSLSPLH